MGTKGEEAVQERATAPDIAAILCAHDAMLRSAAALGEEIAGYAGAHLRQNQRLLQALAEADGLTTACDLQSIFAVAAARRYALEAQRLADFAALVTTFWLTQATAAARQGAAAAPTAEERRAGDGASGHRLATTRKSPGGEAASPWRRLTDDDLAGWSRRRSGRSPSLPAPHLDRRQNIGKPEG